MPCSNTEFNGTRNNNVSWENFTRSVRYNVPTYFEPNNVGDIVWIIRQAETEGRRVKAVGSGWSIEDIATSQDWIIDINRLRGRLTQLIDTNTISSSIIESKRSQHIDMLSSNKLIHVEAGIKIFDLNSLLQDLGLSMLTMGGAQGQKLAGAISTSTHGSDVDFPPLPDLVQAIHLVTNSGKEMWVESESDALTNDNDLLKRDAMLCGDIEIVRNDTLFNSLKVSIGRFGVIYSYVLKVTTSYRLVEWTQRLSWDTVSSSISIGAVGRNVFNELNLLLGNAPTSIGAIGDFRYLDITLNPRRRSECFVRRRWITIDSNDLNTNADDTPLCHGGVGNLILGIAASVLAGYAATIAWNPFKSIEVAIRAGELSGLSLDPHMTGGRALAASVNALWASQMHDEFKGLVDELNQIVLNETFNKSMSQGKRGSYWHINSGTRESAFDRDCFNGTSIELIFSLSNRMFIDYINFILSESNNFLHVGYISVRFSSRSSALLSMHNVDHAIAVSVEVTSLHGLRDSDRWLNFIERRGIEMGGRPHWGQKNSLNQSDVERLYGEKLFSWKGQLSRICERNPIFSNNYTAQRGLEPSLVQRIVKAVRRQDGHITHLCDSGQFWSPVSIQTAIAEIKAGLVYYYTESPNGNFEYLLVRQYLTTRADSRNDNNLRSLPSSNLTTYNRPSPSLIQRKITSIILSEVHGPNPWDRWISYVCNDLEGWRIHVVEAYSHIQMGVFEYFIENQDGGINPILIREYLASNPNEYEEDNLGSLPDCI